MTMLVEGFKIATEFVFDAGLASAEIGAVQGQINELSSGIDDLLYQAKSFGVNFVASFTGFGGGILGVLGSAISSSDEFRKAQLSFSNIIAANLDNFTGSVDTFNERMMVSKSIIGDIIKDARDFAIPAKDLLRTTEIIGGLTAGQGLTGTNFGMSRDLSSNFLKSTRFMGVDPSQSMNQFANMITGHASQQGMFGQRIFKEVGVEGTNGNLIRTAKEWNKFFESNKLLALNNLNKAMDQFTKNAEELAGSTNTLSAIWQRTTDMVSGFASILRPIGDVILPAVVRYLGLATDLLKNQGANIVKDISAFIKPIMDAPEQFLIRLMGLRKLAGDVASAASITGIILSITHYSALLGFLTKIVPGLGLFTAAIGKFAIGIPYLGRFFKFIGGLVTWARNFIGLSGGLFMVLGKLSILFTGFTVIFQALSRAAAKADVMGFWDNIMNSDRIVKAGTRISAALIDIMSPFEVMIDGLSDFFVSFMPSAQSGSILASTLEGIASVFEFAAESVRSFMGVIGALAHGIVELVAPLSQIVADIQEQGVIGYAKNVLTGNANNPMEGFGFGSIWEEMKAGYERFSRPYLEQKSGKEGKAIAQNNVNIGKVDINNNIKHEVQPDRIAFTVKEQLVKLSQNKTSGRGRRSTFKGAFAQ